MKSTVLTSGHLLTNHQTSRDESTVSIPLDCPHLTLKIPECGASNEATLILELFSHLEFVSGGLPLQDRRNIHHQAPFGRKDAQTVDCYHQYVSACIRGVGPGWVRVLGDN